MQNDYPQQSSPPMLSGQHGSGIVEVACSSVRIATAPGTDGVGKQKGASVDTPDSRGSLSQSSGGVRCIVVEDGPKDYPKSPVFQRRAAADALSGGHSLVKGIPCGGEVTVHQWCERAR